LKQRFVYKSKLIAKPNEDGLDPKLGKGENECQQDWNEKTGSNATVVQEVTENPVGKDKDLGEEQCDRYPHCVACFVNVSCG
jgi:hypothetical protein